MCLTTVERGHRITEFQAEGRQWNILEHPKDPHFGEQKFLIRFHVPYETLDDKVSYVATDAFED